MSKGKSTNTKGFIDSFDLVGWFWGLLAGTLVFFGLLILQDTHGITIDRKISFQIDPTNILTILITAYLAVIALRQLNRQDEGDKLERELYIENLKDFHNKLNLEVRNLTIITGVPGITVASTVKNLSLILQETITLIKMSPCDNEENITLINKRFKKLRELLTYGPDESDKTGNVTIKGEDMIYSHSYLATISKVHAELKKAIFLTIIKINRN
jgi:hypothetical protein